MPTDVKKKNIVNVLYTVVYGITATPFLFCTIHWRIWGHSRTISAMTLTVGFSETEMLTSHPLVFNCFPSPRLVALSWLKISVCPYIYS